MQSTPLPLDDQELYFATRGIPMQDIPHFLEDKSTEDQARILAVLEETAIQNSELYLELWRDILQDRTVAVVDRLAQAIFTFREGDNPAEHKLAQRLQQLL